MSDELTPRGAEALAEINRVLEAAYRVTPEGLAQRKREDQARHVGQQISRVVTLLLGPVTPGAPQLAPTLSMHLLAREMRAAADGLDLLLDLLQESGS
jgi:hypothetical protein